VARRTRRGRSGPPGTIPRAPSTPLRSGPRPARRPPAARPWEVHHDQGKALRDSVSRSAHGRWQAPPDRPDPLDLIARSNEGRLPGLIPIRMGRMATSLFGFYRGNAAVMAWDLAHTPVTGIHVLMDGDAHLANFGLFGTVERDVVFDLNDFDESQTGPWEWDLKRLVASVNVAAREFEWSRRDRAEAVRNCVQGYRGAVRRLEESGALAIWYEFLFTRRRNPGLHLDPVTHAVLWGAAETAAQRSNDTLLNRLAHRGPKGEWRFREIPPVQVRVPRDVRGQVLASLGAYARTLPRGRRFLLDRYHPVDVAEHIVGVGSVGARAYVVLLFGNGEDDPLLLQVKEGLGPAATPYLPPLPKDLAREPGKRVVTAQMALQSSPDLLLGWTRMDGHSFYVRQMRNLKGSVPLEELTRKQFLRYVEACGQVLGHAHARTGDAARIAGYCGRSSALDDALARFAEEYGAQVERDHARLVRAVASGHIAAVFEDAAASPRRRSPAPGRGSVRSTSRPSGGPRAARRRPTSPPGSRRGRAARPPRSRSPGTN
jgi:uncharacterized protein (DUF2252 family)